MSGPEEQPELLPGHEWRSVRASVKESQAKARATRARKAAEAEVAEVDPVARVLVDVPLAHLDRPFDYAVPASMAEAARPGVRVKVRFAGQDVDGYLVERAATSDHTGRLAPLRRVVSDEPVLSPAVAGLVAAVAERYAGSRSDVLRLAVPPRHATTEKEPSPTEPPVPPAGPGEAAGWPTYEHAAAYLSHLAGGGAPRAVWSVAPGEDWPRRLAEAAAATRRAGRGTLICVPDGKDVDRVDRALTDLLGADHHVTLTADAGPAQRYRDFLAVSRGTRRIVVGTRAAAFAPVHDLGLVVVWDDGDDLHAEPRAPYPHTRETLLLRAEREGAAALVAGFARSVEAEYLLRTGWAHELAAPRPVVRERVRVTVAGASELDLRRDPLARAARLPHQALEAIREAVAEGPVLVQNPRLGYVAALACERCRTPARCDVCRGPLALTGPTTPPACRWCGTEVPGWACGECGHRGLRAPVIGDARTAEEIGRALPRVRVLTSSRDRVLATVDARPGVVVATPGAEPVAEGGYAAVVLLDAWLLLGRTDLRTEEEALRRWCDAVGLVRPGGRALVVGDPAHPAVQALVRWDPGGFAARETVERQEAHLPPASRLATITGEPGAVDDALTLLSLPEVGEVLGPVPTSLGEQEEPEVRAVVRVPRAQGAALGRALGELQRVRSARKLDAVRIQVDPPSL
ncbi:primosomal protein N' [Nocardioides deserti]|uniref:Probable replication restart protein PriA n=1 Tax=Nocardioides deserti TaxID=1588644 RepID=A0ABR6U686_9ACTN|nr:primosomal protein N' [Nocardioides deserti]MBC2959830.1 primosomal protein N' [Nocardioides deserti]GGO75718.1 putative primosomal protein N' [Nocardioides deserti]